MIRRSSAVLLACAAIARGQADPRAVQPERPTVATHAGTVASGYLEVETGAELDRFTGGVRSSVIPTVLKFGAARRLQVDVFAPVIDPPSGGTRIGDVGLGVKWRLMDDAPLLGRFAVLPMLKLPTGSRAAGAGTGTTDVSLLLISSHDVGPIALDLNAGVTRRSGDGSTVPRDATVWTISTGGPGWSSLGWVAELFGYPRTIGAAGQPAITATLFGPTWSVRQSLALDAGVIVPLSGPQPRATYFGGVWNAGRVF
jgi:hypothetical protein